MMRNIEHSPWVWALLLLASPSHALEALTGADTRANPPLSPPVALQPWPSRIDRPGRDPFALPPAALMATAHTIGSDCHPKVERANRRELEQFPLNRLRLKGIMSRNGVFSAVVQAPPGQWFRVTAGQYIGINGGRVSEITDDYLLIREPERQAPDCWVPRNVKWTLSGHE